MPTKETALPLKIENENNKLACQFFTQITKAPPKFGEQGYFGGLIGRTFFIEHNGETIFVKLKDYEIVKLAYIESIYTLPCSGMMAYEWKVDFMTKNPDATNDTRIGIYCYERINADA